MISSEVQRTLVKSPPELWAELSDPAALARHLGELGEIRITRIEPEQLVEWEAENRTGTVRIKPSGWGTKVTLTVATQVAEPSVETPPAPAVVDEPMPPATDEPAALVEDEPAAPVEDEPAAPVAPVEDEPAGYFESVPSPLGVPMTAAAASSWRTDAEAEPGDSAPEGTVEDDAELPPQATDHEEAGDPYDWQPYEEREPRRGFFARFFDRWRTPPELDAETADQPLETTTPAEPAIEAESALEAVPALEAEPAVEPGPAPEADAVTETEHAAEAEVAIEATGAIEPAAGSPSVEVPSADEIEPALEAPLDEAPAEGVSGAPAAAESEHLPRQPEPAAEQGGDIAAELKAAEETTDADVTAVLTSVLDRLGAAHHRPFSRS
ncbi:MAG TPA: hypothetical protein VGO14_11595 [Solirubrobacteraceae bacterium]|jgi:hypothetical protein|nr:hypothetical protein [Solirubrobacteraceae bacterium]